MTPSSIGRGKKIPLTNFPVQDIGQNNCQRILLEKKTQDPLLRRWCIAKITKSSLAWACLHVLLTKAKPGKSQTYDNFPSCC